jgi:hypothetical protein
LPVRRRRVGIAGDVRLRLSDFSFCGVGTAQDLAKATDLASARAPFKPLSNSLIKYLEDHNARNAYVQIYCPMADANWLQTDKNVKNPYLGRAMLKCGEIKN